MNLIDWLLDSDVSIKYQVHRDLLDSDISLLDSLQKRIETEGFGKAFLDKKQELGYVGYGAYSPKWVSVHYTLWDLYWIGLPNNNEDFRKSVIFLIDYLWFNKGQVRKNRMQDVCVCAMVIQMYCYTKMQHKNINEIVDYILEHQYKDGGWNCSWQLGHLHSSLHTTIQVLESFEEYIKSGYTYRLEEIKAAIPLGEDFILRKELFKSERTGKLIRTQFIQFPFPFRWRYEIARALDYFRRVNREYDPRMEDALNIISNSHKNGHFKKFSKYPGLIHFSMDIDKSGSKWNTLRALRILKKYKPNLYKTLVK